MSKLLWYECACPRDQAIHSHSKRSNHECILYATLSMSALSHSHPLGQECSVLMNALPYQDGMSSIHDWAGTTIQSPCSS